MELALGQFALVLGILLFVGTFVIGIVEWLVSLIY